MQTCSRKERLGIGSYAPGPGGHRGNPSIPLYWMMGVTSTDEILTSPLSCMTNKSNPTSSASIAEFALMGSKTCVANESKILVTPIRTLISHREIGHI